MNKKLRNTLIKVAHKNPDLRPKVLFFIKKADADKTFEEAVKGKKFKHPETENDVQFGSLPAKEQKKVRKEWNSSSKGEGENKGKVPKISEKGKHTLIGGKGGQTIIMSDWAKNHIVDTHTKPGKGSVLNSKISLDDVQKAISSIPKSSLEKNRVHEVKVPNAGYDLVKSTSEIKKKYPNAKKVTVTKEERGKPVEVTGYIVDNDIEDFSTDVMSVVVVPTTEETKKFLPDDLKDDGDVNDAIKGDSASSVVSAWAGAGDIPPSSEWGDDYAVIIPNKGKGADWE